MESIGLSYLLIRIPTVAKRIPNPSSPGLDSKKQRYISVSLLFSRARDGAHEVRWTSNKCADRSEAKTEPFGHRRCSKQEKSGIHSDTTFLLVSSARRGSNPRPSPWQGDAIPLSHSRKLC